jgi:hypothetical protein
LAHDRASTAGLTGDGDVLGVTTEFLLVGEGGKGKGS